MMASGTKALTIALLAGLMAITGARLSFAQDRLPESTEQESPFAEDLPAAEEKPTAKLVPRPQDDSVNRRSVNCPTKKELDEWFKPLDRIKLNSRDLEGDLPIDCSTNLFHSGDISSVQGAPSRNWAMTEFHWQASNLAAQPAYWDDVPLERYGQTVSPALQPGISGAKFFLTFPIIPYKIGVDRTHDLIYTLGYYRPGSPTPPVKQVLPFEWDALFFEAATVSGFVFILP